MNRIAAIVLLSSLFISASAQRREDMNMRKLQLAVYAIENLYVDNTDDNKLTEDAITGMLEKLDPHSTYTDPEET